MNAIDIRPTLLARSDQLNADDLIGGPITVTITDVRLLDADDQPVAIHWEGGEGHPFKPCKTVRRVMAKVWGEDGKAFIGQRMTLYRDDKVRFGSDAVGGIRISHMSGIDRETTIVLMVTRGKRAPYTVKPLQGGSAPRPQVIDVAAVLAEGREAASRGSVALRAWWGRLAPAQQAAAKATLESELKAAAATADLAPADDGFGDMPAHDADTGEILEQDLPGHDDEPEDEGFPGDRESVDSFDVQAWARDIIADETRLNTVAEIEDFFADKEATRRYRALEGDAPALAKSMVAALNGRKKAAASRAQG